MTEAVSDREARLREIAREVCRATSRAAEFRGWHDNGQLCEDCNQILDALRRACAEEREACANLAASVPDCGDYYHDACGCLQKLPDVIAPAHP